MARASTAQRPEPKDRSETVLVSAMRNEAPFVLEWVAYHRVIGIDRIVICANPSSDGTDQLLAALEGAGAITYLPTNPAPDQSALEAALAAFEAKVGYQDGTWYGWLDADEFLNVACGNRTVGDLVAALGLAQGIMLNWRLFGTNGHDHFPGRFISSDFDRASEPRFVANLETKPFFRKSAAVTGFARIGQERPALAPGHTLRPQDFLGGNGKPLLTDEPRNLDWLAGKPLGRTNIAARREAGAAFAQINHYAVRTPEFFRLKQMRGRGYLKSGTQSGRKRYTETYFSRFDRNEAEDRSILHWEAAVTAEIDRLLAIPAVAAAKTDADRLVAEALQQVEAEDIGSPEGAPQPMQKVIRGMEAEMEQETEAPTFELTFAPKERRFVERHYEKAKTILEYGSGGSTVLAARLGRAVISVESDKAWAERMAAELATISDHAKVHYADVGVTGPWGVPMRPREFRKFHAYALSVWDRPDFQEPDLVLIDGRFRAACLVTVMLRAKRPTTVLFDDYAKRRYYHGVEELARKEEMVGRMARFTVTPGPIPPGMMTQAIGWFTDPR
ncbi:glycosyltransferase family 2 protein [Tabrizicola sp.]|uniref:glycosyltransferase family 2 protein n=1 Tax=Tabrizicola sp. TaxID=2005166 RepID=UPI003F30A8FE